MFLGQARGAYGFGDSSVHSRPMAAKGTGAGATGIADML